MKLKDCTKEELIFVIERLQFYSLSGDYYVQRALGDVEEEREARKLREARRLSALRNQKMQEYIDLLAPYDGKRLVDIPDSVFNKASAAMREAEKADRKWNKIMGVPMPSLPGKRGGQRQVAKIIDFLGR